MMLNSMLLSLQNVSAESTDSGETPALGLPFGQVDLTDSESPFAMVLADLNIDLAEGEIEDQDLSALLAEIAEQMGESLPISVDGMPVDSALESDNPSSTMTREQLLSFLMANAGTGQHERASRELDVELAAGLQSAGEQAVTATDEIALAPDLLETASGAQVGVLQTELSAESEPTAESSDTDLVTLAVWGSSEQSVSARNESLPGPLDHESLDNEQRQTASEDLLATALDVDSDSQSLGVLQPSPESLAEQPTQAPSVADEAALSESVVDVQENDIDVSAPIVADHSEALAEQAPGAVAAMVEGEMKNQSNSHQMRNTAGTDAISAQQATVVEDDSVTQSSLNTKLNVAQPVANDKDALLKAGLENQNITDQAQPDSEADLKPLGTLAAADQKAITKAQNASLAAAQHSEHLNRPVKLANAAQGIAERISTMVAGEIKHAVLQLDPAELGHVEVRLQVHNEQTQVQIVSASQQVRDALEQQSARLREALNNQGLNLAQLDVSDQQQSTQSQGQGFAQSDSQTESDAELDGSDTEVETVINQNIGLVSHFV